MIKIVFISIASIGQIDRRLVAEGVGQLGPLEFDPYPTIHIRDLVAHEAHRHPYIEILGTIYLMKLRYRNDFGSRAGSAWRLIFIYALMPWMDQYRIKENRARAFDDTNDDDDDPPAMLGPRAERAWRLISTLMPWMDQSHMQSNTVTADDTNGDEEAAPPNPAGNRRSMVIPDRLQPLRTSPRTGAGLVPQGNELASPMPPSLVVSVTATFDNDDTNDGVEALAANPDEESTVSTLSAQQQQLQEPSLEISLGTSTEPVEAMNTLTSTPETPTTVTTASDDDIEAPAANQIEDNMVTTLSERQASRQNLSQTSIGPANTENRWALRMRQSRRTDTSERQSSRWNASQSSVGTAAPENRWVLWTNGGEEALAAELDVDNGESTLPRRLPPLKNSKRIIVRSLEDENRRLEEENRIMRETLRGLGIDLQDL